MARVHHLIGRVAQTWLMTQPVRVRRLSDEEGRKITQIVRRGGGRTDKSIVKWRRALVVQASAGGNTAPVIAQLVSTSEDRVREMIHRFNELGMRSLDPQWAGGRPRQITIDDEAFIVATAKMRPEKLGRPFTRWSIRKLVAYLTNNGDRVVRIGRERCRQILAEHHVTFQRTKTWKETNDPDRDVKLDRIEHVMTTFPNRCFAFDEFGPLDPRQLELPQRPQGARMGRSEQRRVVLHADLQLMGKPDRGPLRTATRVRVGQLEPPQSRRAHPATPCPPALEKRERPIPETPTRPTQRTSAGPLREGPQMGPTRPAPRSLTPARTFVVKALADLGGLDGLLRVSSK